MSPAQLAASIAAMALGASLQGTIGFGSNLVAAPLLILVDPALVPGPLIAAGLALNLAMLRRERLDGTWRALRWPLAGQAPGAVAGAAALTASSGRGLTVLLATLVLVAVALSAVRVPVRRTPATLGAAGVVSGFTGTVSGIGGPPVALLYQHATGPEIRAALARYFLLAGAFSALVLAAFGRFDLTSIGRGVLLLPGTGAGYLVSGRIRGRVEPRHVRLAVLGVSAASALVALARSLG